MLFLIRDIDSKITWLMIANYIVWAINFILICLSIDIGDKIYTQHGGYKVINGAFSILFVGSVILSILSLVIRSNFEKKIRESTN